MSTAVLPARRRLFLAGVALLLTSVIGFVLAVVNDWPQVTATSAAVGLGAANNGTATSLPLVPVLVVLVATAALRLRTDRGVAAAIVALALMGIASLMAGIASFSARSPYVPAPVLNRTGAVYVVLGLAVAITAALAMRERLTLAQQKVTDATPHAGAAQRLRGRGRGTPLLRGAPMSEQPATDAGTTKPAGDGVSDEELAEQVGGQTSNDLKAEDVFEREGDGAASDTEAAKVSADDLK